ncbi:MAG: endonuclease/exonuclease/phosphatase family protein [Armatimonadetes bacterium]|nr:endonuclease/exonuclease/phosphatase family protein [Armatimonadota bacterium]
MKLLDSEKGPVIVAGDFNSPPHTYPCRLLAGRLKNTFDEGGCGFGYTFSASHPAWRIDHIFVSPEFRTLRCETLRTQASGHLPALAEISYPSGSSM